MEIDKIMKLIDAGFTKDEIEKMVGVQSSEPASLAPEPDKESVTENVADSETVPAVDYGEIIKNAIADGFKDLEKVIQVSAIGNSRLPVDNDDDILAQVIAPRMKERE